MLVVKIVGGLGNQLFQYGMGRAAAERLGVELKLDVSAFSTYRLHDYGLDKLGVPERCATPEEILAAQRVGRLEDRSLHLDAALQASLADGVHVAGGFCDYRYHEPVIESLRQELLPRVALGPESQGLLRRIESCPSVSLHVRRGDYVTNPLCFLMPLEYYQDAVEQVMDRCPEAQFFVFSDDPAWVARNLKLPAPAVIVDHNGPARNVEDLRLMAACRHHVIANSSFSYWAARLASRPGSITIAPQQYFRPEDPHLRSVYGEVRQLLYPPGWEVLPIRQPRAGAGDRYLGIAGGDATGRPMRVGVWSLYAELSTDNFLFENPDAPIGQDLLRPFCELAAYGRAHGIQFETLDRFSGPAEADALIFLDYPSNAGPRIQAYLDSNVPKYLVLFESEMIKPDNWFAEVHARFDRIFTWNDALVDGDRRLKSTFAIDPEPPFDFEVLKSAFHSRRLCTLIAGAKQSSHPNELYSERVRAIRWFERNAPADLDLYGVGWDPAQYPSYRGRVRRKLSTLAGYRFAISYENASGYPGYITEKLLDCFLAGVVPVYAGAPNVADWIPSDCFLRLEDFPDYRALHAHLKAMDSATHGAYLDRIRAFLRSPAAHPFSIESFVSSVTSTVVRDVTDARQEAPLVSVVIPVYNGEPYLEQAIRSALSQEVQGLEVVVVDNASTDRTPQIAAGFLGDPRVRYVRNLRNLGAARNWEVAQRLAKGKYVSILSADDYFLPDHLARMTCLLEAKPDLALAYCPINWVDASGRPLQAERHPGYASQDYAGGRNEVADLLSVDCYITPSAAVVRRAALQSVGGFDTRLAGAIDWDLWIRLAERHAHFGFLVRPTVCYRHHPKQDTARLVANAGLYADHVEILRKVLARGSVRCFRERIDEAVSLLKRKFGAFPKAGVEPLVPAIVDVIRRLEAEKGRIDPPPPAQTRSAPTPARARGPAGVAAALAPAGTAPKDALQGAEALLFDCDWRGDTWVEVVLSYFQAFQPQEPVTLVVCLEPGSPGQVTAEVAQRAILALARSLQREQVPSVAVVDSGAALLEVLRAHQRAQWIPPRAATSSQGAADNVARLAAARRSLDGRSTQASRL